MSDFPIYGPNNGHNDFSSTKIPEKSNNEDIKTCQLMTKTLSHGHDSEQVNLKEKEITLEHSVLEPLTEEGAVDLGFNLSALDDILNGDSLEDLFNAIENPGDQNENIEIHSGNEPSLNSINNDPVTSLLKSKTIIDTDSVDLHEIIGDNKILEQVCTAVNNGKCLFGGKGVLIDPDNRVIIADQSASDKEIKETVKAIFGGKIPTGYSVAKFDESSLVHINKTVSDHKNKVVDNLKARTNMVVGHGDRKTYNKIKEAIENGSCYRAKNNILIDEENGYVVAHRRATATDIREALQERFGDNIPSHYEIRLLDDDLFAELHQVFNEYAQKTKEDKKENIQDEHPVEQHKEVSGSTYHRSRPRKILNDLDKEREFLLAHLKALIKKESEIRDAKKAENEKIQDIRDHDHELKEIEKLKTDIAAKITMIEIHKEEKGRELRSPGLNHLTFKMKTTPKVS